MTAKICYNEIKRLENSHNSIEIFQNLTKNNKLSKKNVNKRRNYSKSDSY